jgi:hypothetical protein
VQPYASLAEACDCECAMTRSASRRDCDGSGAATNLQASFSSLLSNLGPALGGQTAGAVLGRHHCRSLSGLDQNWPCKFTMSLFLLDELTGQRRILRRSPVPSPPRQGDT